LGKNFFKEQVVFFKSLAVFDQLCKSEVKKRSRAWKLKNSFLDLRPKNCNNDGNDYQKFDHAGLDHFLCIYGDLYCIADVRFGVVLAGAAVCAHLPGESNARDLNNLICFSAFLCGVCPDFPSISSVKTSI